MKIESVEFVSGGPSLKFCPEGDIPEFAFIGRSNVGKSSLINMIAGRKGIAKVSGTPGKTRHINHFRVQCSIPGKEHIPWFLVDLPGYGFAKISKVEREKFEGMIKNYLLKRENLALTFLLIDSRLKPQAIDINLIRWLGMNDISFVILFTKTDKPSAAVLHETLTAWKQELSKEWAELPALVMTSSSRKAGRDDVLQTIGKVLQEIL